MRFFLILVLSLPISLGSGVLRSLPAKIHYPDHRNLVRTVLQGIDLWDRAAEDLVVKTGAVESLYYFRAGLNGAPERGFWQIHPETAEDILFRYLQRSSKSERKAHVEKTLGYRISWLQDDPRRLEAELRNNDVLGIILCRIRYEMAPPRLPSPDDLWAQAAYWKRYFNTHLGRGTIRNFMNTSLRMTI